MLVFRTHVTKIDFAIRACVRNWWFFREVVRVQHTKLFRETSVRTEVDNELQCIIQQISTDILKVSLINIELNNYSDK